MQLMTQAKTVAGYDHASVSELLESVALAVGQVIPVPPVFEEAGEIEGAIVQSEMGVLIGFTGHLYGRIIIQGSEDTFGKLGEKMFGMPLEGEILQSFIGELANMISGSTSTQLFSKGTIIDITPPTVMIGRIQLFGFERGRILPVSFEDIGQLKIIITIQKQGVA